MTQQKNDITKQNIRVPVGPPAPPRFLFWLLVGLFLTFAVAGVVGLLIYRGAGRVSALVPLALAVGAFIPVYTLALAVIFRRSLPRGFAIWVALFFIALIAVAGWLGAGFYRDRLEPRYQTELITQMPFLFPVLQPLLPPTPVGGTIPTVAVTPGGPSAADLLLGSSSGGSPTATFAASPTATQTRVPPSATPTLATPATSAPDPTATNMPTLGAMLITDVPPPTPQPAVAGNFGALPPSAYNGGFRHERQDWNNCGPANLAMALSYYGWQGSQVDTAAILKPDREDKNVTPAEMVRFVNEQTFVRALTRIGGSVDLVRALVAAGFPVVVEVGGPLYEGWDWIGHYRTVVGYDDTAGAFLVFDSWLGTGENGDGIAVPYTTFDTTWEPFNRVFVVIYEPAREREVTNLLGDLVTVEGAAASALAQAEAAARENPRNGFAWFNIGTALVRLGNFDRAALAFDEATRHSLPFRMYFYQFGPFEAYYNVGRYDEVLALVNSTLNSGGDYVEEMHYWQGRVFAVQGRPDDARASFQRALGHNPRFIAAQEALAQLG